MKDRKSLKLLNLDFFPWKLFNQKETLSNSSQLIRYKAENNFLKMFVNMKKRFVATFSVLIIKLTVRANLHLNFQPQENGCINFSVDIPKLKIKRDYIHVIKSLYCNVMVDEAIFFRQFYSKNKSIRIYLTQFLIKNVNQEKRVFLNILQINFNERN